MLSRIARATRQAALFLGGMIGDPLRTTVAVSRGAGGEPVLPIVLLVVTALLAHMRAFARLWSLWDQAPDSIRRRTNEVVVDALRSDGAVLVGAAVVAALVALVVSRRTGPTGVRVVDAAVAAVYLAVPLAALKAIGGALLYLGVDLWWLPHHAIDDQTVVVIGLGTPGAHVDWGRFTLKCAVAYLPSLVVGVLLLKSFTRVVDVAQQALRARRAAIGAVVLGALVVGEAGAGAWNVRRDWDKLRPTGSGDAFPAVSLRALSSEDAKQGRLSVTTHRGSVVLVDFWASWCTPCRKSIPEFSAMQTELGPRGLVILGVNREPDDIAAARKAWAQMQPTFDTAVDDRHLGERLGLNTLPTSFLLDRQGVVRHVHIGAPDVPAIRAEVEALLQQP